MKTIIEDFFELKGAKFDITFEECKLICNSVFKFVKDIINKGSLKNIRLQYFGIFKVSGSRVKYSQDALQNKFKNKNMTNENFEKRNKILNNYKNEK